VAEPGKKADWPRVMTTGSLGKQGIQA